MLRYRSKLSALIVSCFVVFPGCRALAERPQVMPKQTLSPARASTSGNAAGSEPRSFAEGAELPPDPEAPSGFREKGQQAGHGAMIVAAHPRAAEAGYQILHAGGSAIDAAIAAQMVLNLVEPQSSGIGGGGFLVYFDGQSVTSYDGREAAPQEATGDLFMDGGGPMRFRKAVIGGRAVGVPGLVAMLELAHRKHGRLSWAQLMRPAQELCVKGFSVGPRLAALLRSRSARWLKDDPDAAAYFFTSGGTPLREGIQLRNPALGEVLSAIAEQGAQGFYEGPIAQAIASKVRGHRSNPGLLGEADLRAYEARERPPLCFEYREYRICGMPPPSSGTLAIGQVLGMLEARDLASLPPVLRDFGLEAAPRAVHLMSEALRLAFADRARYVADSEFVEYPGGQYSSLLDSAYLKQRGALIGELSMGVASAGLPPGATAGLPDDRSRELPSTTHISVVDRWGAAAAMTTSVESGFGSQLMVKGFLLNNQLTDFSFVPSVNGKPVANRVEGGKRPRSSMSPTLVFHRPSGRLIEVTGSPGGSAIISFVLKSLVGTLVWGLSPAETVALPNFGSRNGPTELERGRVSTELIEFLESRGHGVTVRAQTSGVHLLFRDPASAASPWVGAADPRREGIVLGEAPPQTR